MKKNILLLLLFIFTNKILAQNFEGTILYKVSYTDTLVTEGSIFKRINGRSFLNLMFKDFYLLNEAKRDDNESTYYLFDFKNNTSFMQGLKIRGVKEQPIDDCDIDNFEIIPTTELAYIYQKKCFKYILKNKSTEDVYQIWTLEEKDINLPNNIIFNFFRRIEPSCFIEKIGFPMRMIVKQSENEHVNTYITLELIAIKNEKLDTDFFKKYKHLQKPFLDIVPKKD